jgi:hypothetical protein
MKEAASEINGLSTRKKITKSRQWNRKWVNNGEKWKKQKAGFLKK